MEWSWKTFHYYNFTNLNITACSITVEIYSLVEIIYKYIVMIDSRFSNLTKQYIYHSALHIKYWNLNLAAWFNWEFEIAGRSDRIGKQRGLARSKHEILDYSGKIRQTWMDKIWIYQRISSGRNGRPGIVLTDKSPISSL